MNFSFFFTCFTLAFGALLAETTQFVALDGPTGKISKLCGSDIFERFSPCSTFKIPLCIIGFDTKILRDAQDPVWPYDDSSVPLPSHATEHSPQSWISCSVAWYSKRLIRTMGRATFQAYLSRFSYGNQDISSHNGFESAHLSSSLRISPWEQATFLRSLLLGQFSVSSYSLNMTKSLLYSTTLPSGWKIYGKTGSGFHENCQNKLAWFIGWVERNGEWKTFALLLTGLSEHPPKEKRQEMVVQLLHLEQGP